MDERKSGNDMGPDSEPGNDMDPDLEPGNEFDILQSESEKPPVRELTLRISKRRSRRYLPSGEPKCQKEWPTSSRQEGSGFGTTPGSRSFKALEAARRNNGDVSIQQVTDTLDTGRPSVEDTLRRLQGIHIKYANQANKKPKYKKMENPVINQDAYYVLPPKLVNACLQKLPVANESDEAIVLSSQSQPTQDQGRSDARRETEVAVIANVGTFTRNHIEIMQRVVVLRQQCQHALEVCTWLEQDVMSAVRADLQPVVRECRDQIMDMYPGTPIPGLLSDTLLAYCIW